MTAEGEWQQNSTNEMPEQTGLEAHQKHVSDSLKNAMPVWTDFCFPKHVLKVLENKKRGLLDSVWTVPGTALNASSPSKVLLCAKKRRVPEPDPLAQRPHTLTV